MFLPDLSQSRKSSVGSLPRENDAIVHNSTTPVKRPLSSPLAKRSHMKWVSGLSGADTPLPTVGGEGPVRDHPMTLDSFLSHVPGIISESDD